MSEYLRPLNKKCFTSRSWIIPFGRLLLVVAIYCGLVTIHIDIGLGLLTIPIWGAQGIILSGLFSVMHYCCHGTFLPSKRGNRILGSVLGCVLLINFTLYRAFHLAHHRHATRRGDTEPAGEFPNLRTYLLSAPMVDFFGAFARLAGFALLNRYPDFLRRSKEQHQARADALSQVAWVTLVGVSSIVAPLFVLNTLFGALPFYALALYFFSLPEHYGCPSDDNPIRCTRSFVSNPVSRFFYWNSNYHAEHHFLPSAPPWRLPDLHRELRDRLAFVETSYWSFHLRLMKDLASNAPGLSIPASDPNANSRQDFRFAVYSPESIP